ncbi:GNAT family N-acetyltransferase [Candidatus Woesearchaeota archaeon]|nr:GNAT family N-acetyltransferase [Candidatus Woesearchaeota archaeon]
MIEYLLTTSPVLGRDLAEEVHNVVKSSLDDANKRQNAFSQRELETYLSMYSPDEISVLKKNPVISVFAFDNGVLAGNGFLAHGKFPDFAANGIDAFLYGMYVRPEYKKHLLGKKIYDIIIERAGNCGIRTIDAFSIFEKNLKHYLSLGYRKTGEVEFTIGDFKFSFPRVELSLNPAQTIAV